MRRLLAAAVVSVALAGGAVPALAQTVDTTPGELTVVGVRTTAHPEVTVTVTGPSRVGATPAVTVEEDGEPRPATITAVDTRGLEVVLLLDTSGSMSGASLVAARAAAQRFVAAMPAGTRVSVIGFGGQPTVLAPFTDDAAEATAALDRLRVGGETALYDALTTAVAGFREAGTSSHRAIVLLSDGGDTVSGASLEAATVALVGSGAVLHAVGLDTAESDPTVLERLASVSGGTVTSAVATAALDDVYGRIADQLVNRYRVAYRSRSSGRTALRIEVTAGEERWAVERDIALPGAPPPTSDLSAPRLVPDAIAPSEELGPSWRTSRWVLVVGAVGAYGFLALLVLSLLTPSRRSPQDGLADWRARRGSAPPRRQSTLTELAASASTVVERGLQHRGWNRRLDLRLERAGITLRSGEFAVLVASAAATSFVFASLTLGTGAGIVLGVLPIAAAHVALNVLAARRIAAFAEQLPDILQLLAGSLRAGYGLMQALDSVAREAPQPASDEFHRLIIESRLGRTLDAALEAMVERVESDDWLWVVQAIEINREVGGDLALVLDNVGSTIREREQVRRQIKALSAEGRLSAAILLLLPFVVGGLMSLKDPTYILELFRSGPVGLVMVAIGGLLMLVGALWIKRVIRLVY